MQKNIMYGTSFRRGDAGFEKAVLGTSFSARDSGRRPEIVVQANNVDEVVSAVRQTALGDMRISICSGGHSWAQNHIREGGLMLDLSRLKSIEVNATEMTAIIGPGVLAGELNLALVPHKLFFPTAHAWTVGLGGFLLQGGFGWNSRNVGMGCENVIGIDVVLADGTLVHANQSENADLFWAARGAGPGFFGVVVRFHLRLHKRARFIGMKLQVFRIKHLEDVLAWADRVGPSVSPNVEFQIVMNPKANLINAHGMEVLAPVMADSWKEARDMVAFMANSPVRSKASFTLPLLPISLNFMMKAAEKTMFLSNTRWSADNMWMDTPIAPLLPALRRIADTQPPHPSHVLWLNWNGPVQRPDMAFSQEHRTYLALYCGLGKGVDESKHANWATEHMKELEPFSRGIQLADENLARRPAKFVSDVNMTRLDQARAKYDPQGRFHPWMGRLSVPSV
jgi:FAD/FMN-containing dehydrogenase